MRSLLLGLAAAFAAGLFQACAQPSGDAALIAAAGRAPFVLLGESTHGTREYYLERARISEALIQGRGARAIAIEGDWSGAHRLNRYVRGLGADGSAEQALADFDAFPVWMWRNAEFRDFAERLRAWNLQRPPAERVGIYGLDVYDLFDAADAAVAALKAADPAAAGRAQAHYRCFARFRRSAERYSRSTRSGGRTCQAAAEGALAEVRSAAGRVDDPEARFALLRAAQTVVAGEEYFRVAQTTGYAWNARDRRMADAARDVARHVGGKVVIWAHNTHVGDARETSMRERGELSLGQLLREDGAFLVGFLTAGGEVTAAEAWDEPPRLHALRPAIEGSHEAALAAEGERIVRLTRPGSHAPRRLQRAVGVVYAPRSERQSHYIEARLERQFDAIVFLRRTSALTPLARR